MRIEILRDAKGEILATSRVAMFEEVPAVAEVEDGQALIELDVPARYNMMSAADLLERLRGDVMEAEEMRSRE